ncbi:MAG TPA: hypothetical protein VG734_20240 [Lacunisphaera sp.]|nr:hypothetical protein [Lacunisphaera sp.]
MRGKLQDVPDAIRKLREASIPVVERAYGFSLDHPEWTDHYHGFAHCGCEHDGSISLAVRVHENPSIAHFFRFDLLEMADFIIAAYHHTPVKAAASVIVSAMKDEDARYDYDALESRLVQWRRDFDDYWRDRPTT